MAPNEINYWLMKSEPDAYSIKDLKNEKETLWDGIRNYQASSNSFFDILNLVYEKGPEDYLGKLE